MRRCCRNNLPFSQTQFNVCSLVLWSFKERKLHSELLERSRTERESHGGPTLAPRSCCFTACNTHSRPCARRSDWCLSVKVSGEISIAVVPVLASTLSLLCIDAGGAVSKVGLIIKHKVEIKTSQCDKPSKSFTTESFCFHYVCCFIS